jgi:hypothetical protein
MSKAITSAALAVSLFGGVAVVQAQTAANSGNTAGSSQYSPGTTNGSRNCTGTPGASSAGTTPCGPNQTHSAGSGR